MQKIQSIYSGSLTGIVILILIINTIRKKIKMNTQVIPIVETPKEINILPRSNRINFQKDIKLSAIKEANQNEEQSGNKQIARREKLFQMKENPNTILPFTFAREKPRKSSIQILEDGTSIKTYDIPKPKKSRRNSINSLQIQSQNLEEFFSSPTVSPKSEPENKIEIKENTYMKHLLIYKCIHKNNFIGLIQFINRNSLLSIIYYYVDYYIIVIIVGSLILNRLIDKVIRRLQKKEHLYKYLMVISLTIFIVLQIFNNLGQNMLSFSWLIYLQQI
ncbi:hypothetical protein pb186bvf_010640 [Paramecium bursaria]